MPIPTMLNDLNSAMAFAYGELLPTHVLHRSRDGEWTGRAIEDDQERVRCVEQLARWGRRSMVARRRSRLVVSRERELAEAAGPAALVVPAAQIETLQSIGLPALEVMLRAYRKEAL